MRYALDIPREPYDHSVVTDRDSIAWQRDGDTWCRSSNPRVGESEASQSGGVEIVKEWGHLLVDRGPLTLLSPAPERDTAS